MSCKDWCNNLLIKLDSFNPSQVDVKKTQDEEQEGKFSFKKLWAFAGPGLLISIAYIDPGNFDTDIRAGAQFSCNLIWVLFYATIMGMVVQFLSAKLGIIFQKDLAQTCRLNYSKPLTIILWIMAEIAVIASDIPEVLGTAFALKILFRIPTPLGIVITAIDTLLFLLVQYISIRWLEAIIGGFLLIVSGCFVVEMFLTFPSPLVVVEGFVPFWGISSSNANDYLYNSIGLLGAVVMPHNLFLHSALVMTRSFKRTIPSLKETMLYNAIECAFALGVSFFINFAIVVVSASAFYYCEDTSSITCPPLADVGLQEAAGLLKETVGHGSNIIFAIALLASGQSSTITGTYAGQFVMEGFLNINIAPWKRNLLTRSVAIVPSLFVSLFTTDEITDDLIVLSQVILSIQLPFALIPLMKFTSHKNIMGHFTNGPIMKVVGWAISLIVIIANLGLVISIFSQQMDFDKRLVLSIFLVIFMVIGGIIYTGFLGYLTYLPVGENCTPVLMENEKQDVEDDFFDNSAEEQTYNNVISSTNDPQESTSLIN